MKGQGTDKICSLYRGFVILRFFSVYFAVTGARNSICYTDDFINLLYNTNDFKKPAVTGILLMNSYTNISSINKRYLQD